MKKEATTYTKAINGSSFVLNTGNYNNNQTLNTQHYQPFSSNVTAANNFGLAVDYIEQDEQLHRVPTHTKPSSKNGWYVAYPEILIMGDWATGKLETFKLNGEAFTRDDNEKIRKSIERKREEKRKDQLHTAELAREQYSQAQQVAVHPYLSSKGIDAVDGLRLSGKWLLIPLYDVASNTLVNLQRIAPDGTKLFLKGGQISGTGCPICLTDEPVVKMFICEGYATAASIHHMTREPVIAAMNAGNLLSVARAVRQRWPDVEIVIAGDDDWLTEQEIGINPGKNKSIEAAYLVDGKVSFPPFTLEDKKAGLTDWNDYYLARSNKAAA